MFKVKSFFINEKEHYQNKLIETLHKEHKNLFDLYTKILEEKDVKKRLKLLQKFYYDYHLHILKEDKQLYTYLLIKYRFMSDENELIKRKQEEMKKITQFIEDFANKYSTEEALKSPDFQKDLEVLGSALTSRVEFEESKLYALYDELEK